MPAGRPSSLLTGQNRLPGLGAEVASTGSVEVSVVSILISWEQGHVNSANKRTKGILRATRVEMRLRKRTWEPFEDGICALAIDRACIHWRGELLVGSRGRHFVHGLVLHIGMDHGGRLHLALQGV